MKIKSINCSRCGCKIGFNEFCFVADVKRDDGNNENYYLCESCVSDRLSQIRKEVKLDDE